MSSAVLAEVIQAGAYGFRIPLARQTERAVELAELISGEGGRLGRPIAIYLDLPGPKRFLRVSLRGWSAGDEIAIPIIADGELHPIGLDRYISGNDLHAFLRDGDLVYVGDGEASFRVGTVTEDRLTGRVDRGEIGPGWHGLTIAGRSAPLRDWPAEQQIVLQALPETDAIFSFVESAEQVHALRARLPASRTGQIWAKIETAAGAANAAEIARGVDGVLLGRGDLLMSTGVEGYVRAEQAIRMAATAADTPLMVGTQLWTASAGHAVPHRSELSYLWSLVQAEVDYILLSDETTTAASPAHTIRDVTALIRAASR